MTDLSGLVACWQQRMLPGAVGTSDSHDFWSGLRQLYFDLQR